MFSTPQSKAYFNQQVIKGKVISEELNLVLQIQDQLRQCNAKLIEIIALVGQSKSNQVWSDKLEQISNTIYSLKSAIHCSNQNFNLEVSLREEIKKIDHMFFKKILIQYEQKIKDLKQEILKIENEVQELEKHGYLPYVQNPGKNNVITIKGKIFQSCKMGINLNQLLGNHQHKRQSTKNIQQMIKNLLIKINRKYQPQTQSTQAEQKKVQINTQQLENPIFRSKKSSKCQNNKEKLEEQLSMEKQQKQSSQDEEELLSELMNLQLSINQYRNIKISHLNRKNKVNIENLNTQNKYLKQALQKYKKIRQFKNREACIRNGNIDLTRQQCIDFLRDMQTDLRSKLQNRNLYLVIVEEKKLSGSNSLPSILPSHEMESENEESGHCLKEIGNKLTESFLDQCSYLISQRFIVDEDETDETVIV